MSKRSYPHDAAARHLPWHACLPERSGGWGIRLVALVRWSERQFGKRQFAIGGWFFFADEADARTFAAEAGDGVAVEQFGYQAAGRRWRRRAHRDSSR